MSFLLRVFYAILCLSSFYSFSTQIIVVNTNEIGLGSLRQATYDAVSGDTISFDPSLISSSSVRIMLDSSIVLNKNISIKGLYNATDTLYLSGSNSTNIINASYTAEIKLDSLVLIHGNSSFIEGGGLNFYNVDTISIENCVIQFCSSTGSGGGIKIWSNGAFSYDVAYVTILNTIVENNTANVAAGVSISAPYSQIKIADCLFKNNIANLNMAGGGIQIFSDDSTDIEINHSEFDSNIADSGAGLSLIGSPHRISLFKSIFKNNVSADYGGGIGGSGSGLFIQLDSCLFTENKAHLGAAISTLSTSYIGVNNSEFIKNHAFSGGAIHTHSGSVGLGPTFIVNHCQFEDNSADFFGGSIYTLKHVEIMDSNFSLDSADYGGSVYCVSAKVSKSTFSDSYAEVKGGSIYTRSGNPSLDVIHSSFYNNEALYGGAIAMAANFSSGYNLGAMQIDSSEIFNNSADYGGAIHMYVTDGFSGNSAGSMHINTSKIYNNNANLDGGAIHMSSSRINGTNLSNTTEIEVYNSTIDNNAAINNGGAIYSGHFDIGKPINHVTINYSTISNNSAANGGGIYAKSKGSSRARVKVQTNSSSLINNAALNDGGAIYAWAESTYSESDLEINNSTIYDNSAVGIGGGLFSYGSWNSAVFDSEITPSSSILANNGLNGIYNNQNPTLHSLGNNIFSTNNIAGSHAADTLGVSLSAINLSPLQSNGGFTQTRMPYLSSIAIDFGNLLDSTDAQNVAIVGQRDCGAAEFCASTSSIDSIFACDSIVWQDGITYSSNNHTATYFLQNANGCDSIIHLNLTIGTTVHIDSFIVCDSLTWINGLTYSQNNDSAFVVYTNHLGCDSIVFLNLTIADKYADTIYVDTCDFYTWTNGITYNVSTNNVSDTLTSIYGCDSIIYLNLVIRNSDTTSALINSCAEYTWIDGITYTSSNNTATYILNNINGCDSIIYLHLTIDSIDTEVTHNQGTLIASATNATYQWLDCNENYNLIPGEINQSYHPIVNGNYAVAITYNSCVDTSQCLVVAGIGFNEVDNSAIFSIHPNPTTGELILDGKISEIDQILIINPMGQVIFRSNNAKTLNGKIYLDGPSGLYFIRILSQNEWLTYKVLKN
ncbi:hypothetical protein DNU06_06935 [Putridiphycobacter roseus]|uniref:Secretion system C-terminal sorting domain-containing protein n=1 Tax=Putridiphycobacter roseus TaxID=2219161 RepID=A0A2W1N035_9FLAO|nr:T9SS type A sorting domain-containing protein [Putridiphycobacter roseus]PZE17557.1 hypothetical protein DNU06_06935 [Putridiphycobacter roseus]